MTDKPMRVIVGCEFSQVVCKAFRAKGHEAYSCDIIPCEGGHPEWHIQDDILKHLDDGWDLGIFHPPCTYLCRNRARQNKAENQSENIRYSKEFFMKFINASIEKICVENPVPSKLITLPPYSQIIQPYYFGHDYSKKTCLWLKNLPLLIPTKMVQITYITTKNGFRYTAGWYKMPRTSKARSRTFPGVADAMADQWGNIG